MRLLMLMSIFNIPPQLFMSVFKCLTPLAYPKTVVPILSYPVFLLVTSFTKISN
jgi:hypothetical protein